MSDLSQDLRHGLRGMQRSPAFTILTVVALAIGIGATTAILSVVDAVLLRPLPYLEPDRLMSVFTSVRSVEGDKQPTTPADFFDWQRQSQRFESMTAYHSWTFNLAGEGDPEQVPGAVTTAEFFAVFGRHPVLGRAYKAEDCRPGGPALVVLSHGLWQRRFGGDPKVLGRVLPIDDVGHEIIGVMPPGFEFPARAQLWRPFQSPNSTSREFQFLRVIARLGPGVDQDQATQELAGIAARLEKDFPDTNTERETMVVALSEQTFGAVRPKLTVLLGGCLLMLLTACFNVANLLFARGLTRRPEIALRQVLGARRERLLRQLLTENVLLAVLGGAVGLALAYAGVRFLVAFGPSDVPRMAESALNGRTLLATTALTILSGLLFGLIPAFQTSRVDLHGAIRAKTGSVRLRAFHALVGLQIAVALTLLIGAALLGRSFLTLARVPPGFDSDKVLSLSLSLPADRYQEGERAAVFFDEVQTRIAALPGVTAVGAALSLPVAEGMNVDCPFRIDGRPVPAAGQEPIAFLRPVSPSYLQTLRVPLRVGRLFTANDRAGAPPVVVINETLARRFWPDGNPIGQRLLFTQDLGDLGNVPDVPREIVGVVGDIRHGGLASEPVPEIYLTNTQSYWRVLNLVIRTAIEPANVTRPAIEQIWQVDRNLPVAKIRTLDEVLSQSVAQPRFYALLLLTFALFASLLAAVGVYGLMSYSVALRTREFGIRMALGAQRGELLRMVLVRGLLLAAVGTVVGTLMALGLGRFLGSLLFGVGTSDPPTLLVAAGFLAAVAMLSTYLPARRAVQGDPVIALRHD
jgi:putative ABC transport system permease protein